MIEVKLAAEPFDPAAAVASFLNAAQAGGIATFHGAVRASSGSRRVEQLRIDHYPGMTEKCMEQIVERAHARFGLSAALLIHRCGTLQAGDPIVLVAAASEHRADAFAGCRMIIDTLKTDAPFWKKEIGPDWAEWVRARSTDDAARTQWQDASS